MTALTDSHPNGTPQPDAFQQFVPLQITRTVFAVGETPKTITETRHLIFTHFSYRKMAEALGVNLVEMSKQQRQRKRRYAELLKKHRGNVEKADAALAAEIEKGGAKAILGNVGDIEVDDLQSIACMTWAAMITEDPALSVDDVLKMMTVPNQADIIIATVKAYNIFMQGKAAADLDYDSIRQDITDGLKGDASQEAADAALGIETPDDAAEAADVQQARSEGVTAADDDGADPEDEDGAEGNG